MKVYGNNYIYQMNMKTLFLWIITNISVLYGQNIPLTKLMGIYRLKSMDSVYCRLKEIDGFVGSLGFDSVKGYYVINGKIGQSSLQAQMFKERIKIEITIMDQSVYQKIYDDAQARFPTKIKYARGSKNLIRRHCDFIDAHKGDKDLWLILTECYRGDKPAFYEVSLRRYPFNNTD